MPNFVTISKFREALIMMSVVVSDIFGVSGRDMMAALVAGERDPKVLAQMARGSMRAKTARLEEAFTGRFTDHHPFLLRTMLARIDGITADIDIVQGRIDEQIAPFAATVTRLDEIPGVGVTTALAIIAESGSRSALLRSGPLRFSWAWRSARGWMKLCVSSADVVCSWCR